MKYLATMPAAILCAALSVQLVLSPVLVSVAYGDGVVPDPNASADKRPSVDSAPNGVPLVNITAANGSGLSHNQYHDFNVKNQGLILNNSHNAVNTQLGGIVAGNPNFYGNAGAEARVILNEVTSSNRSRIEGYIEVGGRSADVILANPNGITVNGGGFINVPRATLSTGVPQVNSSGALVEHDVRQGDIRIEGAGINADNTDAFTLLARTAQIEAQVRGKNVAVVAGKNRVSTDGTVTPLADDPAEPKPQVAIDSSALGGMYANRITLIATEKGVGVNLEGTVQSADQMVITADGKLRIREAASGGDAELASNNDIELTGSSVVAARDLTVTAKNLRVKKGTSESQYGGSTSSTPALPEPPKSSLLYAGGNMQLATTGELLNEQSEIRAEGNIVITSADGQNNNSVRNSSGHIAAGNNLSISAKTLENFRTILNIQRDTGRYTESRWVHEIFGDGDEVWKDTHTVDKSLDVLVESTVAGVITSGGDMTLLTETFSNSASHIAAGKNLYLLATGSAVNASAALYRNTYTTVEYEHWDEDDDYVGRDHRFVYFTDREVVTPFSASITAQDSLVMEGASLVNSTDRSDTSPLTGRDQASLEEAVSALNESAMFHTVATPGHHYLIETNPLLTKLGYFYGSDYFLSRIGLDMARQQVILLGDAYYETRLVQQQVMESTGQRFLQGYSTDADQMRGLMDAAVAQATGLNLTAGVTLTAAQVAALTQDMIWLVEQEVNGQKVLVPQLYLAANSPNSILSGGSLVAANDVNIQVASLTNSGSTIKAGTGLSVLANNITNLDGGLLEGKNVQLAAAQDIRNEGAFIAGENVSLAAGRDIISSALVEVAQGSDSKASLSRVARSSAITATNSLDASAGRDIALVGSMLQTGGDASLHAGRDLTVGSAVTQMERHAKRLDESSTTNYGSAVAVGGNLVMTAGNDLTVSGSAVGAQGDAVLASGGNLTVAATQDTYSFHMRSSKSGGLGKSSSITIDKENITSNAATVAAGGNLTLAAGVTGLGQASSGATSPGHATIIGSNLLSGQNLTVAATGNVNVVSAQNSSYSSVKKTSSGTLGLSSSAKASGNTSVTQVASNLLGQNITLDAGKSVNIAASNFIASQNIGLTARDGDIAVLDAANQSTSWSYKKQTGFGLGGGDSFSSFYGTEGKREQNAQSTSVGSNLVAGQGITLTSSRDSTILGSSLAAGNDVAINAGRDVNILGGTNTSSSSKEKFSSGFGIGGTLGLEESNLFIGYQNLAKGRETASSTNAASTLAAGNTMTVNAGRNINMAGSGLKAGTDLAMTAGNDIHIAQATDMESISEYERNLKVGLNLTVKQNVTTNAKNIYNNAQSTAQADGVIDGVTNAKKTADSVAELPDSKAEASLTVGVSSAWSSNESHKSTAVLSELTVGRDITLTAGQDLSMQGTQAQAGRDMTLAAGRDLTIHAAESSSGASSASGKISASVGIGAKAGTDGASFGYKGNLGLSGATADNDAHRYNNAKLLAGGTLSTSSGQDTTIAGANLTGKDVDMTVGRDLTVASLQDSSSYSSNSYDIKAGATVGAGVSASASLGITSADGSGRAVGEQTSILGSNSVNIYTENNTHVAGAVIAAVNDNLKLDTGTLSYENVVGKTTQTSTGWGIKWNYDSADEAANNKGNAVNKGDNGGVNPGGGEIPPKGTNTTGADKTEHGSTGQDKAKPQGNKQNENESNKYEHLPQWAGSVFKKTDGMKEGWDTWTKDIMFSPAEFTYARSESTQTAYATIGKGEITIRNNPGQSLDGLNRDPNNAMQTNNIQDFNITISPLFSKISDALGLYGYPATLDKVAFWLTDPKGAWSTTKTRIEESLPFLKPTQQAAQPQTDTQH